MTYDKTVFPLEQIILRGLNSIGREHFSNRKAIATLQGLPVTVIDNFERRHRRLLAAELFMIAFAMNMSPEWVVHEIVKRCESDIAQWRKESGL